MQLAVSHTDAPSAPNIDSCCGGKKWRIKSPENAASVQGAFYVLHMIQMKQYNTAENEVRNVLDLVKSSYVSDVWIDYWRARNKTGKSDSRKVAFPRSLGFGGARPAASSLTS